MQLRRLIVELKKLSVKEKAPIWKRAAEELEKSTRNRREISLGKIGKFAKAGETIMVPGKILSDGDLEKKVTLAAWRFSAKAKEKAKDTMSITELMKNNPKGKGVRLMG